MNLNVKMTPKLDDKIAIRCWGTIVIGDSILCDGKNKFGMDDGKNIACYTHIHDDHICGLDDALGMPQSHVYATAATKSLSSALYGYETEWIKDRMNYHGLEYNKPVNINGFDISFHKANHILGSAQLLVRTNKYSVLYSSDFILEGTDIVNDVDYLVLDSTHGQHSEIQKFDDILTSKNLIIQRTRDILDDNKLLDIYATRGTLQLTMSWLRSAFGNDVIFVSNKTDINIAKVYADYGHTSGKIYDKENVNEYSNLNLPIIRFHTRGSPPPASGTPSIRIGSATATSFNNDNSQFTINLHEHATIPEIREYVKKINPKHVIIDNSKRTNNRENASYLLSVIEKLGFAASLSPKSCV